MWEGGGRWACFGGGAVNVFGLDARIGVEHGNSRGGGGGLLFLGRTLVNYTARAHRGWRMGTTGGGGGGVGACPRAGLRASSMDRAHEVLANQVRCMPGIYFANDQGAANAIALAT